jgi:hypothetical protein
LRWYVLRKKQPFLMFCHLRLALFLLLKPINFFVADFQD